MSNVTQLLSAVGAGDADAEDTLVRVVYDELRKLAAHKLHRENPGQTLQATALVHEAWLRLGGPEHDTWQNRAHFFGAAAEAMRRILIDTARRKQTLRHGGGMQRVNLDDTAMEVAVPDRDEELLAVHEVLNQFAEHDPCKAQLVKLRYFMGLTIEEAAKVLGISQATAKRHWAYARAWLYREINRG